MEHQQRLSENFPKLLDPISVQKPCGEPVSRTVAFDKIRDIQMAEISHGKTVDWEDVEKRCVRLLSEKAKDLQVMSWLTESWMRTHWMVGLGQGLTLILHFLETQWTQLHPELDQGDDSYRVAPFLWIDTKLVPQIRLFPLSGNTLDTPYFYGDWVRARYMTPEQRQKEEDPLSSETIINALLPIGWETLKEQRRLVRENLQLTKKISKTLTEYGVAQPLLKAHENIKKHRFFI